MREFDRKLRLTAALVGATTAKDLARAFHRVNPSTSFDVGRAAKWLQGRAHPREQALYDDWASILGLDQPLAWLLESELDVFTTALSSRHGVPADVLAGRAAAFGGRGQAVHPVAGTPAGPAYLCGSYVCYRHAFSPYYQGRVLRASLSIEAGRSRDLTARYQESLPTGPVRTVGTAAAAGGSLFIDVVSPSTRNERVFVSLFMPQPPASCLAGIYCSTTLISPHAQPAASRILAIRVPIGRAAVDDRNRYLEAGESIAGDLAACGMQIADLNALERMLNRFLRGSPGGGVDQIATADHDELVAMFDRVWIASLPEAVPV